MTSATPASTTHVIDADHTTIQEVVYEQLSNLGLIREPQQQEQVDQEIKSDSSSDESEEEQ